MLKAVGRLRAWIAPCVLLLLPLIFNPWARYPFEPPKVTLLVAAGALIALGAALPYLAAAHTTNSPARDRALTTEHATRNTALAWLAISTLATLGSLSPALSLWGLPARPQGLLARIALSAFFLHIPAEHDERRHLIAVQALLIGSVPVALYGLVQVAGLDPLPWITGPVSPAISTLGSSLLLGGYLAMVLPYAAVRCLQANKHERPRLWTLLLLLFGCLLATRARGAWLGAMVAVTVVIAGLARGRRRLAGLAGLLLAGALGLALINGPGLPWSTRAPGATGLQTIRAASMSQRLGIWSAAANLCLQRPLLGYGPGAFARALLQAPDPATQSLLRRQPVDDAHNLFLRILAETGVAGLLAWLALLGAWLRALRRRLTAPLDPAQRGLLLAALGSACAYLVLAQFNPESIVHAVLFWFALGVTASAPD